MLIIYEKVYSPLKLASKRAPFVVLNDQECVWRHFRFKFHSGGGTLSHPSLEDPYGFVNNGAIYMWSYELIEWRVKFGCTHVFLGVEQNKIF